MKCENCNKWMRLLVDFIGQVERAFDIRVINEIGGPQSKKEPAWLVTESMTQLVAQFRGMVCPGSWDLNKCGEMIERYGEEKVRYGLEEALNAGARHWKYVEAVCANADKRIDTRKPASVADDGLATLEEESKDLF